MRAIRCDRLGYSVHFRKITKGFLSASLCICIQIAAYARKAEPSNRQYLTAASIISLSLEQAKLGGPVLLRGVVTQAVSAGITVQDRTSGIWVYTEDWDRFSQGDLVEVRGAVGPGLFSPAVIASSVRKIGRAALPKPKVVGFRELSSGIDDSQFVSVTGVVRSMGISNVASKSQRVWLKVGMPGGNVIATFRDASKAEARRLIDAVVRIDAAAMCTKNQNMQIIAATLSAGSMDNLTILRPPPADLFAGRIVPIGRLMQFQSGTDYFTRVRIAGTVTYYQPGENLILEDAGRALLVHTPQEGDVHLGDRLEAVGFPAPSDSGPILDDAIFRDTGSGVPLKPVPTKISDISSGATRYELVSVLGHLVRRVDEPSSVVLVLQDGPSLLLAELAKNDALASPLKVEEGSTIRVSGIILLDVQGTWNYGIPSASNIRYKLMVRSPDDVQLVTPPTWWTSTHLVYIALIFAVLTLGSLALLGYSRVEQWKLQAVLEERERLANEIHDTLAQSFAGIGFQIQAIRRAIPSGLSNLESQVELARDLVRHSHKEARQSIEPLRLDEPDNIDLLPALEACAKKMVGGSPVEIAATVRGHARTLPPHIAEALLRIGQEAIANAVRHADPHHLEIVLAYENNTVHLRIVDDGVGFVVRGDLLGFGLRGMRKRAAAIAAKLAIVSQPGRGTQVDVTLPLPPAGTLGSITSIIMRICKRPTERLSNVDNEQHIHSNTNC